MKKDLNEKQEAINERVARLEAELSEAREELSRDITSKTNELIKIINSVNNSKEYAEGVINLIRAKVGV